MLTQIPVVFGAVLWSFLGTIHILYTFFTNKLEPRDPATTAAMKATSPVLTWLPVAGGAAQLAIARRYFFRTPSIGVAMATLCFLVAAFALSF